MANNKEYKEYTGPKEIIGEYKICKKWNKFMKCRVVGYYYDGGFLVEGCGKNGLGIFNVDTLYDGEIQEEEEEKEQAGKEEDPEEVRRFYENQEEEEE